MSNKSKAPVTKNTKDNFKQEVLNVFNSKNKITNVKVEEPNAPIDEAKKKWNMNEKILNLFAENIQRDQELKEKYAIILIKTLKIQLYALLFIFILKGFGVLSYSDSTFNIFITGGLAEIFILVRVIVKYLFKDNLTNALNIILENNNPIKRYTNNYNKNKISYKNKKN